MKAIAATQYGGPEVLQLQEGQKPASEDHEMLIKYVDAGHKRGNAVIRVEHNDAR